MLACITRLLSLGGDLSWLLSCGGVKEAHESLGLVRVQSLGVRHRALLVPDQQPLADALLERLVALHNLHHHNLQEKWLVLRGHISLNSGGTFFIHPSAN